MADNGRIEQVLNGLDTCDKIKYFMWLTNTYGKPIEEHLDFFCREFVFNIKNGLYINKESTERLWKLIKQDIKEREADIKYTRNWGHTFYMMLNTYRKEIEKELDLYKTDIEKVAHLKKYIKNMKLEEMQISETDELKLLGWCIAEDKKDNTRIIVLKHRDTDRDIWCAYNEDIDELKVITNPDGPHTSYDTTDKLDIELINQNKLEIINHLDNKETQLFSLSGTLSSDIPFVERLKDFKYSNVIERAESVEQTEPIIRDDVENKTDDTVTEPNKHIQSMLNKSYTPEKPQDSYIVEEVRKQIFELPNNSRLRITHEFNGVTYKGSLGKSGDLVLSYTEIVKNKQTGLLQRFIKYKSKDGTKLEFKSVLKATSVIEDKHIKEDISIENLNWFDMKGNNISTYLKDKSTSNSNVLKEDKINNEIEYKTPEVFLKYSELLKNRALKTIDFSSIENEIKVGKYGRYVEFKCEYPRDPGNTYRIYEYCDKTSTVIISIENDIKFSRVADKSESGKLRKEHGVKIDKYNLRGTVYSISIAQMMKFITGEITGQNKLVTSISKIPLYKFIRNYDIAETDRITKRNMEIDSRRLKRLPNKIIITDKNIGLKLELDKSTMKFTILDKNKKEVDSEYSSLTLLLLDIYRNISTDNLIINIRSSIELRNHINTMLDNMIYVTAVGENNLHSIFNFKPALET